MRRAGQATAAVTGVAVAETLGMIDQLFRVVAFRLADESEVVAKARPSEPRLEACVRAQAAAHTAGIPCPQPLGATLVDGWSAGRSRWRSTVRVAAHGPSRSSGSRSSSTSGSGWTTPSGAASEPGTPGVEDGREQPTPPAVVRLAAPGSSDATLLGVDPGTPILTETRTITDQQEQPLEYTISNYVADRYALRVDFTVVSPDAT